jgi:cysteine desulfurase
MKQIYCDIAATTPIAPEVLDIMEKTQKHIFGNPSSIHKFGQDSKVLIESARKKIALVLKCLPSEIYFTSGGSESNNTVLFGSLKSGDHIISSSIEHPSIRETLLYLQTIMDIEITWIKPNHLGEINHTSIEQEIKPNTKLISIMFANNELGTINQIQQISKLANDNKILFHTDAVQAFGKIPIDLSDSHIDFLSISAHKLYGPKGIGVLFIKTGNTLIPLIHGGGQEKEMRAGTENIPSIAGFGLAATLAFEKLDTSKTKLNGFTQLLIDILKDNNINFINNGTNQLPGFLNLTFPMINANDLLVNLDMLGIAISAGSACASGATKPSRILTEIGLSEENTKCTVRISFGRFTTDNDVITVGNSISNTIKRLINV